MRLNGKHLSSSISLGRLHSHCRSLQRNMPWQLCLVVFLKYCGSLLSLVDNKVYKSGVQHDVPLSSLVAAGCAPCCETPYGYVSKSQDITSCTGPYLFAGKEIGYKHVLEVGALTSAAMLSIKSTRSAPVSWSIDQSIGCTSGDEMKTHSILDTSSWTKHVYNYPGM